MMSILIVYDKYQMSYFHAVHTELTWMYKQVAEHCGRTEISDPCVEAFILDISVMSHSCAFSLNKRSFRVPGGAVEDQIPAARPKSVRGNWPLWPPGGLPWPPAVKYLSLSLWSTKTQFRPQLRPSLNFARSKSLKYQSWKIKIGRGTGQVFN